MVEIWTTGFPGTDPNSLREYSPEIVRAESSEIIAARDQLGRIASAMVVNIDIGRDKKRGRIDDVATHPDHLRQGYAGLVLDFAVHWFRENGVQRVYLSSSDDKKPAHKLYLSRGFQIHDTNEFQLDL